METKDDSSEFFLENSTLYVGDLDSTVEENELFNIFNQITDDVYSVKICRDRNTSSSLGYGFVNFKDSSQAEGAMKMLNFKKLKGKAMRIMFSERNPSKRISGRGNVFVKNLHESIDNEQLSNIFSQFDKVISAKVARDAYGVSKGYGFVQFQSELLVNIACDVYNGKLVCNQHIQVCPFISRHQWDTSPVFTNVYVKNLSKTVTDDDLKSLFGGFGEITSAVVMRDGEGKSKRFGFVNFDKSEAAITAIEKMNGQRVDEGNELYVGRAQKKKNRVEELKAKFELRRIERASKGLNLYVKNLDSYVDKIKLEKVFSVFGTIISCKVMVDSNRMSKGVGFIEFSTSDEASKAMVEMNGKMVGNKPIYVSLAKCKEEARLHLQTQFNSIPQDVVTPAPTFYQHSILNQVAAPWTMLPPQPPFTAYNLEPFGSRLQNGFPPMHNPYFLMPQPAAPPLGLGPQPSTGVYHCCNHSHGHPIHMFQ